MSTTFSKLGPLSVESSVSGFGPHIEELHAYFKTRDVTFGSPKDLKPFMDRLDSDTAFRDEMGSLVRTIIYQERDGLSWAELMELLAAAVGGAGLDDVTEPEVRTSVRRLMVFVESVFRTRRNPGSASGAGAAQTEPEKPMVAELQEVSEASPAEAETAEPPKVDVFFRAQKVAEEREFEAVVEQRLAASSQKPELLEDAGEVESGFQPNPKWHIPFEDFEDRKTEERGSPAWLWVAGLCALMLAFCAGLFVHQRLIVPLRAPNTPYEAPPPEARQPASTTPPAPTAAGGTQAAPGSTDTIPVAKGRAAKPGAPVGDASQLPRYMAPAMIGASPAAMEARLVYAPPPSYPMVAEMTRIQGKVMVEAVVGKSGRVIRAQAISGHRLLRGAAVREVFGRRYRPYLVNDRPTNVATMVTVNFRLK